MTDIAFPPITTQSLGGEGCLPAGRQGVKGLNY
jgi:hypothetical protein